MSKSVGRGGRSMVDAEAIDKVINTVDPGDQQLS